MTRWFQLLSRVARCPTRSLRALSTMPPLASLEDTQLISDLIALSKKSSRLVKSSVHSAPADADISVRSWKMNEWKYYDVPSPFPTLARGLFSTEIEPGNHRIVARGYDKFFNIGEVPWTSVSSCGIYFVYIID
jgi:tRNA ligase